MKFATFVFSGIAAVTSVATLGIVLFGAQKMQKELDEVKSKTSKSLTGLKKALSELDV